MTTAQPRSSNPLRLNPTPFQREFMLDRNHHCVAFISGSGAGKTVAGKAAQVMYMLENPGQVWLVAEPTWDMVDRILLTDLPGNPSLISWVRMLDPDAHYVRSRRTIYSQSLGNIVLVSGGQPEGMEGVHAAGVWLDEAGQMSKLAYETAERRCSAVDGRLRITTTPYNRGWLFRDVYQLWEKGDQDIHVIRAPSTSNPAYSNEAFERNRRNWTAARFNMMMLGGFERPEGMIYTAWNEDLLVEPFDIPDVWPKRAAVDLGWNHPTGAVAAAQDPSGTYYLYWEHRKGETLIANHAKTFKTLHPPPEVWYGDPAAAQERAELRNAGLPIVPANNEVLAGIDTVQELMTTGRLRVFNNLLYWQDGVEGYQWDSKDDLLVDKPIKIDDDLMDATRYLLHTWERQQAPSLWT